MDYKPSIAAAIDKHIIAVGYRITKHSAVLKDNILLDADSLRVVHLLPLHVGRQLQKSRNSSEIAAYKPCSLADWAIAVAEDEAKESKNESCMALSGPWTPVTNAFCTGIIPGVRVFGMANRNVFDGAAAKDIGPINPDPGICIMDDELSAETPKGVPVALASGEAKDICP